MNFAEFVFVMTAGAMDAEGVDDEVRKLRARWDPDERASHEATEAARAAAWAERNVAASKLEQPNSRIFPAATRDCSAARVSSRGVAASGKCSW